MKTSFARGADRRRRRAALLLLAAVVSSSGCALVPTWDDIDSATSKVTDTVTGKARRNRQTQTFAEARIMERRKEFIAAEQMYRELLKEEPQSRDCYHRLAVMASVQGKFDEANGLYQQAMACGRPTADLLSDVGYCHYLQSQLPEAEAALKQAVAMEPQHRAALNNLALVVGESGNLDEAYRLFRQSNSEAEAESNFAFLCSQCGELERAQHHYSRALSYNPEMRVAAEALIQVTQRMQMQAAQQAEAQGACAAQSQAQGDPASGVRQVSYEEPVDAKPKRPLIEVYAGGPSRSNAAAANVSEVMAAQSAGPNQTPNRPHVERQANSNSQAAQPTAVAGGFPQPQMSGQVPGSNMAAAVPYSFQAQSQPQYLQPTMSTGNAYMTGSGGNANFNGPNAAGSSNSTAMGQSPIGSQTGNGGSMINAGGPFPPLVGERHDATLTPT